MTDERRFEPRARDDTDTHLDDNEVAAARQNKLGERLEQTLAEATVCLDDAATIVALGRARFDSDVLVRRAAKNVVTELAETVSRLPDTFVAARPGIAWREITGMRTRIVHAYQDTDFELVWNALADRFREVRPALVNDSTE